MVCDEFAGDPRVYFYNGYLKFTYFLNYKNNDFESNLGSYVIGDPFTSYGH